MILRGTCMQSSPWSSLMRFLVSTKWRCYKILHARKMPEKPQNLCIIHTTQCTDSSSVDLFWHCCMKFSSLLCRFHDKNSCLRSVWATMSGYRVTCQDRSNQTRFQSLRRRAAIYHTLSASLHHRCDYLLLTTPTRHSCPLSFARSPLITV